MDERGKRPGVFVSRAVPDAGLDLLRAECEVDVWPGPLAPPRTELLARVRDRAALLVLPSERVDDELLDACGPGLRVVATYSVGHEHIDGAACASRGVAVGYTPGAMAETTADLAWALMMAASRRLTEAERYVRAGRWAGGGIADLLGTDVGGATLGIIGFGRIGRAVARRALGFGMTVLYTSGSRASAEVEAELRARHVALDELLERSDIVSLHAPLTADTRHLIDAAALARMKAGALLVNTARGGLVDHEALLAALRAGRLRAALDVTDPEPLPPDHPLVGRDDCLVVPHIGSATVATRSRMAIWCAQNILAGLHDEPLPYPLEPGPGPRA